MDTESTDLRPAVEVAGRVGITYRQLDYWARTGVWAPLRDAMGSGTRRGYSQRDIAVLRLLAFMSKHELSIDTLRAVAESGIDKYVDDEGHWLADVLILQDGRTVAYVGEFGTEQFHAVLRQPRICTVVTLARIGDFLG